MKKFFFPLVLAVAVAALTYNYSFLSFVWIGIMALCLIVLLIPGLMKLFGKRPHSRWVRMPMMTILMCLGGIAASLLKPLPPPVLQGASSSEALAHAYQTDQGDRKSLRCYLKPSGRQGSKTRDNLRLEQVSSLYGTRQITTPRDKFQGNLNIYCKYLNINI